MKINYSQILKKNMLNVFRDVLKNIEVNDLQEGHHLYITFQTDVKKVVIPDWLKAKHPKEMTIIIQYDYWNFKVKNNSFNIGQLFSYLFQKAFHFYHCFGNFKINGFRTYCVYFSIDFLSKKLQFAPLWFMRGN